MIFFSFDTGILIGLCVYYIYTKKYKKPISNDVLISVIILILAKQKLFPTITSKIECFDGSEVAFDQDAFANLNAIVKEIADGGNLTIPANLTVNGNVTIKGQTTLENNTTVKDGKGILFNKKAYAKFGNLLPGRDGNDGKIVVNQFGPGLSIVGHGSSRNIHNHGNVTNRNSVTTKGDVTNEKQVTTKGDVTNEKQVTTNGKTKCKDVDMNSNKLTAKEVYSSTLDTDTLKGHAWKRDGKKNHIIIGNDFKMATSGRKHTRVSGDGVTNFNKLVQDAGSGQIYGNTSGHFTLKGKNNRSNKIVLDSKEIFANGLVENKKGLKISGHTDNNLLEISGLGLPYKAEYFWRLENAGATSNFRDQDRQKVIKALETNDAADDDADHTWFKLGRNNYSRGELRKNIYDGTNRRT